MSFLDPIFNPLLQLPVLWAVIIISLVLALIIIVVYRYTTNQEQMKQLKDEMKDYQKQMKELRNNPEKMMEVQKKAMQANMKYMSSSMKSTLITFIPIILIFGWMNNALAYEPILPGQEFTTTAVFQKGAIGEIELVVPEGITLNGDAVKKIEDDKAAWVLKGNEGEYLLEYKFNGESYTRDVLITNKQAYKNPVQSIKNSQLSMIKIENKPVKLLNLFGWRIGWLGTYIIFSIIFSMLLRKLFKVY